MLYLSHILKNIFYVLCASFAHIFCIHVNSCNVVILRGPQGRIASANCVILSKHCINRNIIFKLVKYNCAQKDFLKIGVGVGDGGGGGGAGANLKMYISVSNMF